ncbi:Conserved_hypothetical protein [Hexamita inflata]|uniref:Uncharacterized protein n=1 Tax=Hexamita inflata TaxID=28002 RepID=A0ABP1GFC4_9EUKA
MAGAVGLSKAIKQEIMGDCFGVQQVYGTIHQIIQASQKQCEYYQNRKSYGKDDTDHIIVALKSTNEQRSKQLKQATMDLQSANSQIIELKDEIERVRIAAGSDLQIKENFLQVQKENEQHKLEVQLAKKTILELQQQKQTSDKYQKQLEQDFKQCQLDINKEIQEKSEMHAKFLQLQHENTQLINGNKNISSLQTENADLRDQLQKSTHLVEDQLIRIRGMINDISVAQTSNQQFQQQFSQLQIDYEAREQSLKEQQIKLIDAQKQISFQADQLKQSANNIQLIENIKKESEGNIQTVSNQLKQKENVINQQNEQIQQLKQIQNELQQKVADLNINNSRTEQLQNQITQLKHEHDSQLKAYQNQLQDQNNKFNQLQQEKQQIQSQFLEQKENFAQSNSQFKQIYDQNQILLSENLKYKENIKEIEQRYLQKTQILDEKVNQNEQITNQMKIIQQQMQEYKQIMVTQEEKYKAGRNELLNKLQSEQDQVQSLNSQIQKHLDEKLSLQNTIQTQSADLKNHVVKLEAQNKHKDKKIEELERDNTQLAQSLAQQQSQLSQITIVQADKINLLQEYENKCAGLREALAQSKNETKAIQQSYQTLKEVYEVNQSKLDNYDQMLEQQKKGLQNDIQEQKSLAMNAQMKFLSLQQKFKDEVNQQKQIIEYKSYIQQLKEELSNYKDTAKKSELEKNYKDMFADTVRMTSPQPRQRLEKLIIKEHQLNNASSHSAIKVGSQVRTKSQFQQVRKIE